MSFDPVAQAAQVERLETENLRLRRAVEELSVLNDVASAISSLSSLDEVINLIVKKCVKHLKVAQGAVSLFETRDADAPLKTVVRKVRSSYEAIPLRLGVQITGWMMKHQEPLVIQDLASDSRFTLQDPSVAIRSILCVPLRLKGRMIGVAAAFNKQGNEPFSEADQRLLTIISAQSAQVVENARLAEEEAELGRLEQELDVARDIQIKLLPANAPTLAGFDIAGRSLAARQVGGDYYDFLEAGENKLGVCLGDVSGKGISSALLVAGVQAVIRSQNLTEAPLAVRLSRANQVLHASSDSDKFATFFYAQVDAAARRLEYSNAGHNPPVLFSDGEEPRLLEAGGPVLGILPGLPYEEASVDLKPGDLLLIYSDGFSEAMNLRLEEYGEERLHALAGSLREEPAETVIDRIIADVADFTGEAQQSDDMTIVVVRCKR